MPAQRPSLQGFRQGDGATQGAAIWVAEARTAAQRGDLREAGRLLRAATELDPRCVEAWLGLAWLAETPEEREALLNRVLELEPGHAKARAELERLRPSQVPFADGSAPPITGTPDLDMQGADSRAPEHRKRGDWLLALATALAVLLALILASWGTISRSLVPSPAASMPTPTPLPMPSPAQVASRFVPQLQAAISGANWDRALQIVALMQGLDSTDANVKAWALATHMHYGRSLVQDGRPEEALLQFEQAIAIEPLDTEARLWTGATRTYLAGRDAAEVGDWDTAIRSFTLVQSQIPDYGDLSSLLLEAYLHAGQQAMDALDWTAAIEMLTRARDLAPEDQRAVEAIVLAYRRRGADLAAHTEKDDLERARADLELALSLRPDDAEAKAELERVMFKLFPPKRIEINISQQRMFVWEGDTLIWKYVVSTGLPGRDTATGHFKVLDKIPMAYSSVWQLKMPYWLGIYYVGGIENGIHALPIRPDGSVMWGGLLGQKASYGCVILNNQAAKDLYDWAEIGTKVDIHY